MTRVVLPVLALAVVLTACSGSSTRRADDPVVTAVPAAASGSVKVVATGDIVCPRGAEVTRTKCRHEATARLTGRIDPDHVIPLGDLQYEKGRLRAFRRVYDDSWGAFKQITEPVPGNHEYQVPDANGFFGYFGTEAPGYYAWDAGSWRVYNLNAACDHVDCAAQVEWLRDDLTAHPRTCSMIVMHRPRYSSGLHGSDPTVRRFWRIAFRHRVDVALAGHDHDYERFLRMNHRGEDPTRPGNPLVRLRHRREVVVPQGEAPARVGVLRVTAGRGAGAGARRGGRAVALPHHRPADP